MKIIRQTPNSGKKSDSVFAVYYLNNGDYVFCFASHNYYISLDFFLRLDLPNVILCRISVDDLPAHYHLL